MFVTYQKTKSGMFITVIIAVKMLFIYALKRVTASVTVYALSE